MEIKTKHTHTYIPNVHIYLIRDIRQDIAALYEGGGRGKKIIIAIKE